jgi:phosphatidylserine/phosphatidylglycerophosphate/cardiolipin synthase-like enzyme
MVSATTESSTAASFGAMVDPKGFNMGLKYWFLLILIGLSAYFSHVGSHLTAPASTDATSIDVYFSPHGGCTEAVVNALGHAKQTAYVQAYSFTSAPIAQALVEAYKRGVRVKVVLDKSQRTEKYSSADFLAHSGIPVQIDSIHGIAHNKVIIIDDQTVITGSFNFTKAAESHNAENLLLIRSKDLVSKYLTNWWNHSGHSEAYAGR